MRFAAMIALLMVTGCRPKATDSGTITDINPCSDDEILASNGECVPGAGGGDDTGS